MTTVVLLYALPALFAAARLLKTLTEARTLQSTREHQAGSFWRSDEILHAIDAIDAIDAFAERAGRRQTAG